MKAKILFILLSTLFIIPVNAINLRKHYPKYKEKRRNEQIQTRSPLYLDINVQEADDCLQIIFLDALPDAEITITDKDGNIVINESKSLIYEGKTLYIYSADNYPYSIEITSPILDLAGEITLE